MSKMSAVEHDDQECGLPRLRENLLLDPAVAQLPYDVKFYPFAATGADPVFAVASAQHVLIYRVRREEEDRVAQLIYSIKDAQEDAVFHSLAWTKDIETGGPVICAAGSSAKIQIFAIRKGGLCRTLIGHGGDINDLAISPTNLSILASASADNTVRLWNLDPAHQQAPCVVVYAGKVTEILSFQFHSMQAADTSYPAA